MRVLVKDITGEMSKIAELVNGDKTIPGVLLSIEETEMKVRFSDGKKAFSGTISIERNETDPIKDIVVDYTALMNILNKSQPSGIITVDWMDMDFVGSNTINIKVQQKLLSENDTGEEEYRVLAEKNMQLTWNDVDSSLRTKILGRMDYDSIFNADSTDEWDTEELQDVLTRCGVEKSRVIYMSPKIQRVFVANLAHTTEVPVSSMEVSPLDIELLTTRLSEEGMEADDVEIEVSKLYDRMKFPVVISTGTAKQICGILNKIGKGKKIYLHTKGEFLSIFTGDEKNGIWFAMSEGSKAQTNQFEKYRSVEYNNYQISFIREFLVDAVKSAIASSASEKLAFSFEETEDGETEIVMTATNSNASINDTYRVICDDIIDTVGDIDKRTFKISLKVFDDMLSQLKTTIIAMDIKVMADGSACIRLAELDDEKALQMYYSTRERLQLTDIDPTPIEEKMKYRDKTLKVSQYTLVAK